MGGSAYLIYGTFDEEKLYSIPLKRNLLDKLLKRQRYVKPKRHESNNQILIDFDFPDLSKKLIGRFKEFLYRELENPWPATESFFDFLSIDAMSVYFRGEIDKITNSEKWYIQLTTSGCAGMAETSAQLATHWAELWFARDKEFITNQILIPAEFTPAAEQESFLGEDLFLPVEVGDAHCYGSTYIYEGSIGDIEIDAGYSEGTPDEEAMLSALQSNYKSLIQDGICKCQLCCENE